MEPSASYRPAPRRLSRRTVLRGAGVMLGLPWLQAMAPRSGGARAAERTVPQRLVFVFVPNGKLMQRWTPDYDGVHQELPATLAPLQPFQERLLVLSGLFNRNSLAGEGHYVKTTALLSGAPVHKTGGRDLRCGQTVDQLAAARLGHHTALPSLELGLERVRHAVDMGYSTVYGATLSWRTPTRPASKEVRPRQAFDRLFRRVRLRGDDRSVLDLVLEDGQRLRGRLGVVDRSKLDEHLDGVRALERRIAGWTAGRQRELLERVEGVDPPPARTEGFVEHLDLMLDVIALALRADATRVVTLMLGNSVSGRDFSFLDGVEGGHHPLSHHQDDPHKQDQYARINRWHVDKLGEFAARLDAVGEGEDGATLLDQSMVFYGSGIGDGNRHDPHHLPLLVLGGGGGRLHTGRHLRVPHHTPLCNLYVDLLDAFGCPVESFGDSTGSLGVLR